MPPQISCILAAYNASRYLREAVGSILAQTFRDFELICINDGSADDTGAILDEFARNDPRVKVIHKLNAGQVHAAIDGIAIAQAPLIARMDADDFSYPDRFQKQIDFMHAHPEVVVLGGAYELIDADGRLLTTLKQPLDDASLQKICLSASCPICQPLAIFRRDAYDRAGGYRPDASPAEDLDLWLRMGDFGKLACLPDVLLKYRQHAGSLSETRQQRQMDVMQRAARDACARRGLPEPHIDNKAWRATEEHSLYKQHLKYGWWAFNSGNREGARHYGKLAVRMRPFALSGYKLLYASFKPRKVSAG